jgi:bacteriocin leader peptide (microcyclamide/patellamide family)
MDKQKLIPQAAKPVNRITTGQLPAELAELSEEALQLHGSDSTEVLSSGVCVPCYCRGVCVPCYD